MGGRELRIGTDPRRQSKRGELEDLQNGLGFGREMVRKCGERRCGDNPALDVTGKGGSERAGWREAERGSHRR